MTIFSAFLDQLKGIATSIATFPEDRITNLTWEAEDDGTVTVFLVELPESKYSELVQLDRERSLHGDQGYPGRIKAMGGKRRELGKIAKEDSEEDIGRKLKQMLASEMDQRAKKGKSDYGVNGESFSELVNGSAASIWEYKQIKSTG